ncbi:MAG: hypothetical protein QOG85_515 [Gaiellaceae bacterium]|jgi:hypothetical protein|nr:hypothetical protein [Gaiellaceae bacterium]
MSFEGGYHHSPDTGEYSARIAPPVNFPKSGHACYGCPGYLDRLCCQHDARAASHIPHSLVVKFEDPE